MTGGITASSPTNGSRLWVQWTLSNRGCPGIVSFAGVIDAANADHFVDTLTGVLEACTERLIIDLSDVDLGDAAAATALLRASRHAKDLCLHLDVVCSTNVPRRVLTLAGDDEEVEFYGTVAEALQARTPRAAQSA